MKTRARIVPVVAIALVAALALFGAFAWIGPNGSDAGLARDPKSGRDSGSGASLPTEPVAGTPSAEPAAGAGATPSASAEPRRAEDPPVVPEGQLLVVVRRAAAHSGGAGARVTWAAEFLLARERDLRGSDESYVDPHELLEDVGDHGTTDARGFLFLPDASKVRRGDRLTISARLDPLFGLVVADGKKPVVPIDLKPDDAIRVQILAADGTPQPGLVAAFGMRGQSQRQSRRGRTEGKDGIATIRGLTAFTQMFSDGKVAEWGVSAVAPLRLGSFVPVDLAAIPSEPVVVRLPACGRMSITLQRRDGSPLARKARVTVTAFPRFDPLRDRATAPSTQQMTQIAEDGVVELPFVDCGLTLSVGANVDRVLAGEAFLNGPDSIGERVERTLVVDVGPMKFVGAILRGDDAPAVDENVVVRVVSVRASDVRPFEAPCTGEGRTDDQGRFSIEVAVAGSGPEAFDCELDFKSATGLDHTLKAVAVVGEKGGAAQLGILRLPER
jgi:hypothetical protein